MRKFPLSESITAHLIFGLTLGTTLLWCAGMAFSTYASYRELNEAFDGALQEAGRRLLPLAADDALGHADRSSRAINRLSQGRNEYLSFQLRDASGSILLRANDAPFAPYEQSPTLGFASIGNYRLYTSTDTKTGLTLTVAETMTDRWEALVRGAKGMLASLVGLLLLNTLVIMIVVRRSMNPVRRLSDDISTRSGDNLAPLDISDQPSELKPIANAVARLVERLRAALDAERAFAANSAHELRTPIAGALAQTQRMITELGDPKDRRRARDVEATLKRLSSLAEKLMQLSRVDAGVGLGDGEIDVIPILDLIVGDCAKGLDEPERLHYLKTERVKLVARIDMDAFAIATRNLVDNAIKHGAIQGKIEVNVRADGAIRIINEGKVVPPELLSSLKDRYARGESRAAGSGLGLAIVETIMKQTGGTLELFSPAPGRADGFEARLTLNSRRSDDRPLPNSRQVAAARAWRA